MLIIIPKITTTYGPRDQNYLFKEHDSADVRCQYQESMHKRKLMTSNHNAAKEIAALRDLESDAEATLECLGFAQRNMIIRKSKTGPTLGSKEQKQNSP